MIELMPIAEIVGVTSLIPIVGMALSRAKRLKALENANYQCQANGKHEGILEAAHIDHTRAEVNGIPYDDERRVEILCTAHHLQQHRLNFGVNGLNTLQNWWAINRISDRLKTLRGTFQVGEHTSDD